jgi:hypothetical protein
MLPRRFGDIATHLLAVASAGELGAVLRSCKAAMSLPALSSHSKEFRRMTVKCSFLAFGSTLVNHNTAVRSLC